MEMKIVATIDLIICAIAVALYFAGASASLVIGVATLAGIVGVTGLIHCYCNA